ncbi:hypothetical protein IP69_14545 [Bosea sp. AAP35]|uniref:hypothetical protein n=1 Tax=Bosea sp. AAP35 TaxID=1523417 RepID=UPI0006B964F0|nr:hypothetical protein [Bosea sp. AAP35]KPF66752.1 hypothetical protein IP69_14545 [Bosea sp. AAP35]
MSIDKIKPQPLSDADKAKQDAETNRPGFDLGGAKGKDSAGRGLGLGPDSKDDREGQRLPRDSDKA